MLKRKIILTALFLLTTIFMIASQGLAAVPVETIVLPDPNAQVTTPIFPDGDPVYLPGSTTEPELVASLHDDFYAYAVSLNIAMGLTAYNYSVGTGGLDMILYTGSEGANNNAVGQVGFGLTAPLNFEDPLRGTTGSEVDFAGTWGTTAIGDPKEVTVDKVLEYLRSFDPNNSIPVFYFDMNQSKGNSKPSITDENYPGVVTYDEDTKEYSYHYPDGGPVIEDFKGEDLFLSGYVQIWDPDAIGNKVIAEWSLDNLYGMYGDDEYNADWPLYIPGTLIVGNGEFDPLDNNAGSGRADFISYAPTMDLNNPDWLGKGYQFRMHFEMQSLTDGFEEVYLTGAIAPSKVVPEPASIFLFTTGLAGMILKRRKK